jgi:plastocyanin
LPPLTEGELQLPPLTEGELQLPPLTEGELQLPPLTEGELQLPPLTEGELQLPLVLENGTGLTQDTSEADNDDDKIIDEGKTNGNTVSITSNVFEPSEMRINIGDTVAWKNDDTTLHTVTSGSTSIDPDTGKEFDSSFISAGNAFNHRFDRAGTFPYYCSLHPIKTGVIIVS